ncbi:hypothetical protein BDB00DRAFT_828541 [Zychaea mexicana]|uniref:uncharacterized protein n=1 Tax=Zychaea mexicana TaxID=64656 RepID=UPI0022FEBFAD|nr:uncharacterized protein BDB00DRAFT_828541 [Zychaea mexicana]KAI9492333.1 hypothetical protein BDB00DRAFT_828541 [Zychaea mexicana]
MYANAHSTKRFPTACRFFSQGNCRAGDECLFAHILPIKGSPSNLSHDLLFGDLDRVDAIANRNDICHHADSEASASEPLHPQPLQPPETIPATAEAEAMTIAPASLVQPQQRKSISTSSETHSIHKAIRDLELGQLEKNYKPFFQQPSINFKDAYTVLNISLPIPESNGDPSELHLQLLIPYDYPQTQCTIQIKNADIAAGVKGFIEKSFEKCEWQQQRHLTLLQHLDWLKSNFAVLHSQAITGS